QPHPPPRPDPRAPHALRAERSLIARGPTWHLERRARTPTRRGAVPPDARRVPGVQPERPPPWQTARVLAGRADVPPDDAGAGEGRRLPRLLVRDALRGLQRPPPRPHPRGARGAQARRHPARRRLEPAERGVDVRGGAVELELAAQELGGDHARLGHPGVPVGGGLDARPLPPELEVDDPLPRVERDARADPRGERVEHPGARAGEARVVLEQDRHREHQGQSPEPGFREVLAGVPLEHRVGDPEEHQDPPGPDDDPQDLHHAWPAGGPGGMRVGGITGTTRFSGMISFPLRAPSTIAWCVNTAVAAAIRPSRSARCHGAPAINSALEVPSTPTTSATNGRERDGSLLANQVGNHTWL